jgi:hypothetical protein
MYIINPYAPATLILPPLNSLGPILTCGFECGLNSIGGTGTHFSPSGGGAATTLNKRTGTYALRIATAAGIVGSGGSHASSTCTVISGTHLVARFYIYFKTAVPTADSYIAFISNGTASDVMGACFKNSDSKIYAASGAARPTFGASGVSVVANTWYLIDLHINQTSGAKTVDVKVNGTACGQKGTTGTSASAALQLGSGQFVAAATSTMDYDDFILSSTLADYPIGAGSVYAFVPTADGTHNITTSGNFIRGSAGTAISNSTTDSYLLVDDQPLNDSAGVANDYITYVVDVGSGNEYVEHIFGPAPNSSTQTSPPRAVDLVFQHHQAANTTNASFISKLYDAGTLDTIYTFSGLTSTNVQQSRKFYANPPSGLGGWSLAGPGNFNDLRHRFGYSTDASPDVAMDAVMIEAEFAG